jgi:guanosine-3',5'-bis(diphosphate) 3'-pyrophosphohydrolase
MTELTDLIFSAVAFAARAHRHHLRKDKETPYVSHVFRVCLVVRHVFGFDDPRMLTAALLHDTIEDTNTDCDDIIDHFGPEVARWVSALTKETRLPHDEREHEYARRLAAADWQVKVIKLADIYDNITDCATASPAQRKKTAAKARFYLQALRENLPPEAIAALKQVETRLQQLELSLTP